MPHPRHDDFLGDPTHVRPVSPIMLSLFDREQNDQWLAMGAANTPLAHYTGIDFKLTEAVTVLAEPYASRLQSGEMSEAQVQEALSTLNNVAREFHIRMVARKA